MAEFQVTIRATVIKTYTIEAESEDEASSIASDVFTVGCDDIEEDYDQQVTGVAQVNKLSRVITTTGEQHVDDWQDTE